VNATSMTVPEMAVPEPNWVIPGRGRVAMFCLIAAESAIFTIFVVAYLFYVGKNPVGPQPRDVLDAPIFYSLCLLSSSLTIHQAVRALRNGKSRKFGTWLFATIVLGATFLYGTASEWHRLIYRAGVTISTNLFGTTYYSGWSARVSRHRRTYVPGRSYGIHSFWKCKPGAR